MTIDALVGASRLTPGILESQMTNNLDAEQAAIARLQEKVSSGQAINRPSDDPVGVVQALTTQAALARSQQYQANANDGLGWLSTANTALSSAVTQLYQVRNIALGASSNSSQPSTYADLAQQVDGIRQELLSLANSTYLNRPVFAGTSASSIAYDPTGAYVGSGNAPTRTVAPGTTLPVSVTSPFGNGAGSVFAVVDQISADLRAGTTASISNLTGADLTALDQAISKLSDGAGQVGTMYQQMQYMASQATSTQQTLSSRLAQVQDTNLAKTITDLQAEQNSYQAALWATAKVIEPSLTQFLS